jgi:hypothetical protein
MVCIFMPECVFLTTPIASIFMPIISPARPPNAADHDPFEHQTFEDFKASFTSLGVALDAEQESQIRKLFDQMEAARAAKLAEEEAADAAAAAEEAKHADAAAPAADAAAAPAAKHDEL